MRHHLSPVQQISPHHCFVACLSSFFIDNGLNISQKEIVNKCPSLFNAGTDKEGSFETKNLKYLESAFPITISLDPNPPSFKHPKQSIFFITFWNNDKEQKHCVRINSIENNKVILMNPNYPGCTQELDKNVFTSWKKAPILIEI